MCRYKSFKLYDQRKGKSKLKKCSRKPKNIKAKSKIKCKSLIKRTYKRRKYVQPDADNKVNPFLNDKKNSIKTQYHPIRGNRNNAALYFKETHTDERPKRVFKSVSLSSSHEIFSKFPQLVKKPKDVNKAVQVVTTCGTTINKKLRQAYEIVNSALKFGVSAGVLQMFDGTYRVNRRLVSESRSETDESERLISKRDQTPQTNSSSTLFRKSSFTSSKEGKTQDNKRSPDKKSKGKKSSRNNSNSSTKSSFSKSSNRGSNHSQSKFKKEKSKGKNKSKENKSRESLSAKRRKKEKEKEKGKEKEREREREKEKEKEKERICRHAMKNKHKKCGKVKKQNQKRVRWLDKRKHNNDERYAEANSRLLEKKVLPNPIRSQKLYHSDDQIYNRSNFSRILENRTKPNSPNECYGPEIRFSYINDSPSSDSNFANSTTSAMGKQH